MPNSLQQLTGTLQAPPSPPLLTSTHFTVPGVLLPLAGSTVCLRLDIDGQTAEGSEEVEEEDEVGVGEESDVGLSVLFRITFLTLCGAVSVKSAGVSENEGALVLACREGMIGGFRTEAEAGAEVVRESDCTRGSILMTGVVSGMSDCVLGHHLTGPERLTTTPGTGRNPNIPPTPMLPGPLPGAAVDAVPEAVPCILPPALPGMACPTLTGIAGLAGIAGDAAFSLERLSSEVN
jgi:hypothetical protein